MSTPETATQHTTDPAPNQARSFQMLPGLGPSFTISDDLEQATKIMVESRRAAGVLTDLDDALVALALSTAQKLDQTVGIGRPSGRAKLLAAMSDILDQLPAPTTSDVGLLPIYVDALLGRNRERAEQLPTDEPLPLPELDPMAGPQEQGMLRTLVARGAAGISTKGWAAHEALALMAAADIDRAKIGAPSGFAALSSTMASILDRLPRPTDDVDGALDKLLSSIPHQTSPFTALPEAQHHPERDPEWLTEGHEIAAVARALGRHFMPWQRKAVDVATEYRINAFGFREYRYHTVVIVVPRQSGKTDLTIPVQIHRAITRPDAACWYTAQSGQDARKRIMELIERAEGSPIAAITTPTRSNGAEGVRVDGQPGSHVTRFSPTYSALHGEHPPLVTLDEFWHFPKDLGDAILGAIEPAQITLGMRAQTWMISTMGTASSQFMNEIVDDGRAGTDPGVCYIEYSLPEGLDPFDPESWPLFHPALGNTITVEDLARRARRAKDNPARRATFLRAYCNRVVASDGSLLDLATWDDLALDIDRPDLDKVSIGFEVAPANASAAVVASWIDEATGRPATRILRQAPGTSWLVPFLAQLHEEWNAPLVVDGAGPSGRFTQQLEDLDIPVRRLTLPEYGQASEAWLAAAGTDATLIHDGTDELRAQAAELQVRISNGVRRISRDSTIPVPAIIASAVALYNAEHPAQTAESIVL